MNWNEKSDKNLRLQTVWKNHSCLSRKGVSQAWYMNEPREDEAIK
jgi:hypothetical protein